MGLEFFVPIDKGWQVYAELWTPSGQDEDGKGGDSRGERVGSHPLGPRPPRTEILATSGKCHKGPTSGQQKKPPKPRENYSWNLTPESQEDGFQSSDFPGTNVFPSFWFSFLNYECMITHLQETWRIQSKVTYSSTIYDNYFLKEIN